MTDTLQEVWTAQVGPTTG